MVLNYERIFHSYGFKFELLPETSQSQSMVKLRINTLPQSNDNQFEESDFHNLVTAVRNYDADPKAKDAIKSH